MSRNFVENNPNASQLQAHKLETILYISVVIEAICV